MRVLVLGASGRFGDIAAMLIERGHAVRATTRSPGSSAPLRLDGEARHSANLAQALVAGEVPHLVFVSGDGATPDSPLPLFRAKWQVEEADRASGIRSTILAPTYLMENLFNPWNIAASPAGGSLSPRMSSPPWMPPRRSPS